MLTFAAQRLETLRFCQKNLKMISKSFIFLDATDAIVKKSAADSAYSFQKL